MLRTIVAISIALLFDRAFTGMLQSLDRDGAPARLPAAGSPVEL